MMITTLLMVITGVIFASLCLYVVNHDSKHGYDCFRPESWEK